MSRRILRSKALVLAAFVGLALIVHSLQSRVAFAGTPSACKVITDGARVGSSERARKVSLKALQLSSSVLADAGAWAAAEEVYDLRPLGEGVAEQWRAPARAGSKELRVLRGLVAADEVAEILASASSVEFQSEDPQNPVQSPLAVLATRGRWTESGQLSALRHAVQAVVDGRVVPYMRRIYDIEDLVASEVMLRQYDPNDMPEHALHFDYQAAATCVVDFTPMPGSGLYVQPGAGAASREFVPLREPGDAAVHSWDVRHGVTIRQGHARVSLVVWAKPRADAESGLVSWYGPLGAAGDIDAAYRLGMEAESRGDFAGAARWHEMAADAGHWMSMWRLGVLRLRGSGTASDEQSAIELLEASAKLGWADAQFVLGLSKALGQAERSRWLSAAAEQGHAGALNSLAVAAAQAGQHGAARELLAQAAVRGHPKAMQNLALYLQQGVGGPADPAAAERWAARGAKAAASVQMW